MLINVPVELQSSLYFNQGGFGGGPSAQMLGGALEQLNVWRLKVGCILYIRSTGIGSTI